MDHQESFQKIYINTNYSLFSMIEWNRSINSSKVDEYAQMIKEGYSQDECPILVTEKMEILDGQHRFEAAKKMNTPIFYIISKKSATSNAMVDINQGTHNWKIHDYVKSFADRGNSNYQKLLDFCSENKVSYGIAIICFGYIRRDIRKIIVQNKFQFNEEKKIVSELWIKKWREFLSRLIMSGEKSLYQSIASYAFLEALMTSKNKKDDFFDAIWGARSIFKHSSGYKGYTYQFLSLGIIDL